MGRTAAGPSPGRLHELKAIRTALGGTVNDVLAAITGAFRDLLVERGDPVDVVLHSLVPVSVRAAVDTSPNNQVAAMVAELPVGIADPVAWLTAIQKQMTAGRPRTRPRRPRR